jgi:hypothetical protein
MPLQPLTPRRIKLAFAVGILADILQLPVSLSLLAGFVPAEGIDAGIDLVAAVLVNWLLGFHWALLPSFALKLIPVLDVAPTWTACVAYVALQRRHWLAPSVGFLKRDRSKPSDAPPSTRYRGRSGCDRSCPQRMGFARANYGGGVRPDR